MLDDQTTIELATVSPGKAARRHCLDCCNGSSNEVALCPAKGCALWTFRFGHRPTDDLRAQQADITLHPNELEQKGSDFTGSALKAIKLRCLDCSGFSKPEVAACAHTSCDLHAFRQGRNPNRVMSDENRDAAIRRLEAMRDKMRSLPENPNSSDDLEVPTVRRAVA
jgi:hypothetical protein